MAYTPVDIYCLIVVNTQPLMEDTAANSWKHVYLFDSQGRSRDSKQGQSDLLINCHKGDTIHYRIIGVDPAAGSQPVLTEFVRNTSTANICNPTNDGTDPYLWKGTVKGTGTESYTWKFKIGAGNKTYTWDPKIVST